MTDKTNNVHKLNGSSPHTLEDQVVAALQDPNITATDLATLVAEVEQGVIDAGVIADRLQQVVLDPVASPDANKAQEVAQAAQLVARRLENVLPRLRSKRQTVLAQQRAAKWTKLADVTQADRDTLASEFAELYPQWVNKLVDLFERVQEIDRAIDQANSLAPSSESRRLLPIDTARIAADTKLLDLSGTPVWPPPAAPINVNTIVPHLPAGGDWHETIAQRDAQRRRQSAKAAAYYHQQARDREDRENAEARAKRERGTHETTRAELIGSAVAHCAAICRVSPGPAA